jgi:hypothetical protein
MCRSSSSFGCRSPGYDVILALGVGSSAGRWGRTGHRVISFRPNNAVGSEASVSPSSDEQDALRCAWSLAADLEHRTPSCRTVVVVGCCRPAEESGDRGMLGGRWQPHTAMESDMVGVGDLFRSAVHRASECADWLEGLADLGLDETDGGRRRVVGGGLWDDDVRLAAMVYAPTSWEEKGGEDPVEARLTLGAFVHKMRDQVAPFLGGAHHCPFLMSLTRDDSVFGERTPPSCASSRTFRLEADPHTHRAFGFTRCADVRGAMARAASSPSWNWDRNALCRVLTPRVGTVCLTTCRNEVESRVHLDLTAGAGAGAITTVTIAAADSSPLSNTPIGTMTVDVVSDEPLRVHFTKGLLVVHARDGGGCAGRALYRNRVYSSTRTLRFADLPAEVADPDALVHIRVAVMTAIGSSKLSDPVEVRCHHA